MRVSTEVNTGEENHPATLVGNRLEIQLRINHQPSSATGCLCNEWWLQFPQNTRYTASLSFSILYSLTGKKGNAELTSSDGGSMKSKARTRVMFNPSSCSTTLARLHLEHTTFHRWSNLFKCNSRSTTLAKLHLEHTTTDRCSNLFNSNNCSTALARWHLEHTTIHRWSTK